MQVIEYDGRALLNFTKNKKAPAAQKESLLASSNYPSSYDQQVSQMHSQASASSTEHSAEMGNTTGGEEPLISLKYLLVLLCNTLFT